MPTSTSDRPERPDENAAATLPTYALYGEYGRTRATDWLHCESIADRSRRHDWEIRPHRHATLFQILYIHAGSAEAWLDGEQVPLAGPCLLLLPALVPHGFVFAPAVEGLVITVLEQHLARLLQPAPALAARLWTLQRLAWAPQDPAAQVMAQSVARLQQEFLATGAWRDLALDAALLQLAVLLGRCLPEPRPAAQAGPAPGQRALAHVQQLRTLVEAHFRQQPRLATLARTLGITPTQLNRVCHQVLGHSALGVLHGRLLLEAQRDLAYTTLAVKQIALGLGFADAGYFSRFFQRHTGHSPSDWRALASR